MKNVAHKVYNIYYDTDKVINTNRVINHIYTVERFVYDFVWVSVYDSVWNSVRRSIWYFVWGSVRNFILKNDE